MDQPPAPGAEHAAAPPPLTAPGRRRIPAQVWDAAAEARRLRETAEREAAELIARARGQADELRAAAALHGREEGLARAAAVLVSAAAERDRLLASAEAALVELVFAVAGRVVSRLAERDREIVAETAARALDVARGPAVVVRAHPDDLETLREAVPRLGTAQARTLRLAADPSVSRGGVIIETDTCRVDARLDTQLELLRRVMEEREGGSP